MPVSADGTVYDWHGPEGAPVLALVHGLGLTRATWDGLIPALAARYRVLNYDLLGHGESALPDGAITLASFSEQLVALMDELGVARAAVVGFSLGGMINRRLALDHPDRASALVILNSPHERGAEAQRLVEERARATDAGGPGATIEATLERWFTPGFRAARRDVTDAIRGWVMANDPVAYTKCRYVLAAGVTELIRPATPITAPTLVMTCEHDSGSTPAMAHAIAGEIPGAQSLVVPGLQHMGLVEEPKLFTEPTLAFLDTVLADRSTA